LTLTAFVEWLIWEDAKAPVATRERTKARTTFFMDESPWVLLESGRLSLFLEQRL